MKKRKHRTQAEFVSDLPKKGKRLCDFNGNTGKNQLPMAKRCENLLALIHEKGERGIWEHYLCDRVVAKLLERGDVYKHREQAGFRQRNYTHIVSSAFPQPGKEELERRREQRQADYELRRTMEEIDATFPKAKGPKRTIKWSKAKQDKLLFDVLAGTADKDIVEQTRRTKTLPKKITK